MKTGFISTFEWMNRLMRFGVPSDGAYRYDCLHARRGHCVLVSEKRAFIIANVYLSKGDLNPEMSYKEALENVAYAMYPWKVLHPTRNLHGYLFAVAQRYDAVFTRRRGDKVWRIINSRNFMKEANKAHEEQMV